MKLRIDVTQEGIDQGVRSDADACMIQRAILRCSEGAIDARVTWHSIDTGRAIVNNERRVRAKIRHWDFGNIKIRPFSFDLDLPEAST